MNQSVRAVRLGLVAMLSGVAQAEPTMVDDFDQYSDASYVQTQMWSLWRRFGEATTDGIYSIARGAEGRGGHYAVNWTIGKVGYLRYTFPAAKSFSLGTTFAMDLAVTASLPNTQVFLLVADGDPNLPTTTTYRTREGQPLTDLDYGTHGFEITEMSVRRLSGRASLSEVLGRLASVTFIFSNATDAGAQGILIDNFQVSTPRSP